MSKNSSQNRSRASDGKEASETYFLYVAATRRRQREAIGRLWGEF